MGKRLLTEASPVQLVLARTVLCGVALTAILVVLGRGNLILREFQTRRWRIVALGLLSFFLSSGLSMLGLSLLPASINSLLANTSPLMVAIGLVALTRRVPSPRLLGGLALGFGGVGLLTWGGTAHLGAAGLFGVLLSLGGSAAWAVYTGWSRQELVRGDPIAMTAAGSFVGSIPLLAYAVWSGELAQVPGLSAGALWLLLYAGIVGTALTYALWMTGLTRLSATSVSAFQYVIPLVAVLLSVLWLGEPLTAQLVLGGLAILAGVTLAQERGTTVGGKG